MEEAELAVSMGADVLGLVSAMPSGPGVIPRDRIRTITWELPEQPHFVLTSQTSYDGIMQEAEETGARCLQLVADTTPEVRYRLSQQGIGVVQVVHVEGHSSIDEAIRAAEASDEVLLDSGSPGAATPLLGGTGRTHNWTISREVVARLRNLDVPVWLAGGLHPGNITEAIESVQPHGVDVCSGLRIEGKLDAGLLSDFVAAVRQG